jgi:3-oxoacyl-[acyl-carrier-protein] synthase II
MSRVVITGIGVNSPIGCSLEEALNNIETGFKGISTIRNFSTECFPCSLGAEVKSAGNVMLTTPDVDRKSIFIQNSIQELIGKNDFLHRYTPSELMINIGAGIDHFDLESYVDSGDYLAERWEGHCKRAIDTIQKIAEKYSIQGGHYVNVSACVASTQAIGNSFRLLRKNGNSAIISGGFDSMLSHLHYMGFYKLGALSEYNGNAEDACKPFDKKRSGLVIGEGGIAILLESVDRAPQEKIIAEIVGYSSTLDAFQVTDPEPNGNALAQAAKNAIADAGILPEDIDCVHMHETGTIKNALAETNALKQIFGNRFKEIPVYSMKGQIGHLIGACGAMEFLGVVYSIKNQKVPPTVNFETPDPEVPLNVIKGVALEMDIKYILKINAAFGGQNTALVIKKYDK